MTRNRDEEFRMRIVNSDDGEDLYVIALLLRLFSLNRGTAEKHLSILYSLHLFSQSRRTAEKYLSI